MKEKRTSVIKKVYRITSSTLAALFILVATIGVIFYANGYRIGRDGIVERTGVLTIKSKPSRSEVILNGVKEGKTTKTFSSLSEDGEYTVNVSRSGYHTWSKSLKIKPEKSTPLFAYLFRSKPEKEVEATIDNELLQIYRTEDFSKIFFITVESTETEEPLIETVSAEIGSIPDQSSKTYRIWSFNNNQRFWDTSDNPQLIVEHQIAAVNSMDFKLSPDGELALWIVSTLNASEEETETGEVNLTTSSDFMTYLLETGSPTSSQSLKEIDLEGFLPDYTIDWSLDSKFLILESEEEILSQSVGNQAKLLLLKKDSAEELIWTTDEDGNFYFVKSLTDDNQNHYYQILRQDLAGSTPEPLIDKIYSYETNQYLNADLSTLQTPFTNSIENPRFAGEISKINIHNDGDSLIISTTFALYWYSIEDQKYTLVSNKPAQYLSTNENSTKFIFTQSEMVGVFTFDKEEEDHTESIGTKLIFENSDFIGDILWHSNSEYIFYADHDSIRVVDDEGDNNLSLIELSENQFFSPSPSSEELIIIEGEIVPEIVRYTIH